VRGTSRAIVNADHFNVSRRKDPLAFRRTSANIPSMPTMRKQKGSVKSRAIRLIRDWPTSSSWDDFMYRIYVRQKIEAGLADIGAGRVHSHDSIREEFGVA
jgi:hypothetical protein